MQKDLSANIKAIDTKHQLTDLQVKELQAQQQAMSTDSSLKFESIAENQGKIDSDFKALQKELLALRNESSQN